MNDEIQDLVNFGKSATVLLAVTCFALAMTFASAVGVFGIILVLAFFLPAFSQYMFVILERAALGHNDVPVLSPEMVDPFQLRPMLALLLIILFVAAYGAAREMGYGISNLVVLTAIGLLPAMLSILAISGNHLDAVNPRNIMQFIVGMKFGYLRAVTALVVTGFVIRVIGALHLPEVFIWFLFFYAVILVFRYLGHVIYLHRDKLGLAAERGPELDSAQMESLELVENKRLMDHIFDCSNTGQYDKGYLEVMEYARRAKDSEKTVGWFIQQALQWDNKEIGLRLAQWLVSERLDKKNTNNAWLTFEQALMANAKFRARDAKEAYLLARYAKNLGKKGLALDVLAPFTDENSPHALSLSAIKLAVQISSEGMNDADEARRLILIARRHGGLDSETENYFEQIENA